jgi:hypothetical protein
VNPVLVDKSFIYPTDAQLYFSKRKLKLTLRFTLKVLVVAVSPTAWEKYL